MQNDQEKYFEIDLMRLLAAVWHKAWVIALAAVVCAAAALGNYEVSDHADVSGGCHAVYQQQ